MGLFQSSVTCERQPGCGEGCLHRCQCNVCILASKKYFRNSHVLDKPILLLIWQSNPEHAGLLCTDIISYIARLLINLSVKERILQSLTLPLLWVIKRHAHDQYIDIESTARYCRWGGVLQTMLVDGVLYRIPTKFWHDNVYFSRTCECPSTKRQI